MRVSTSSPQELLLRYPFLIEVTERPPNVSDEAFARIQQIPITEDDGPEGRQLRERLDAISQELAGNHAQRVPSELAGCIADATEVVGHSWKFLVEHEKDPNATSLGFALASGELGNVTLRIDAAGVVVGQLIIWKDDRDLGTRNLYYGTRSRSDALASSVATLIERLFGEALEWKPGTWSVVRGGYKENWRRFIPAPVNSGHAGARYPILDHRPA